MTQAFGQQFLGTLSYTKKEQYLLTSDFAFDCSISNELVMTAGTPWAVLSKTYLPNVGFFSTLSNLSRCLLARTD